QKHEKVDLRALHRYVELVDQIERVVAGETREIEILGEQQRHENGQRKSHFPTRQRDVIGTGPATYRRNNRSICAVPGADVPQYDDSDERRGGEPRNARLSERKNYERSKQWPDGRARISADLKHRLRKSM